MDLRIEGPPAAMRDLRDFLAAETPPDLDLDPEEITSSKPGELREPVAIGLIVALGGPRAVREVREMLSRWLTHRERMYQIETIRLHLLEDDGPAKEVTLEELTG
jgi:hypothetical protein